MVNQGNDEFWDKPSWRDRDKRKDRSRHVGQDDRDMQHNSRWVRKQVLKEADKLFNGNRAKKKMSPEQDKNLNEIHRTVGTKKFDPAVKNYLKTYGLPEDWSTLMLLLEFTQPDTLEEAIERLKALYPQQGLQEQQGFRSKLNIIAMTAKDEKLRYISEQSLATIDG